MAEKSFPFNAGDPAAPDRTYNADDVSTFDAGMYTNGVVASDNQLVVTAGTGMTTEMDSGYAWIRGKRYYNDSPLTFTHDPADGVLNRIDRIILRHSVTNRSIIAVLLKGTSGASPTAPALTRTTDVWEIALADVLISAGVTSITSDKITDQRANAAVCGMVTANAALDTTGFQAQADALVDHVETVISNAEDGFLYEPRAYRFDSVLVDNAGFVADTTYADYPFRAAVPLAGVLASMDVDVRFDAEDAISAIFAPVATSYNGGIYLYASEVPASDVTIPRIICEIGTNAETLIDGIARLNALLEEAQALVDDLIAEAVPNHASTHAYGGDDVLDPGDIGQYGVAEVGSDGKVKNEFTELGYQSKSASYQLVAGDEHIMTNFTATANVTIPASTFDVGVIIPITVSGGTLTVVAGSGVTLVKVGGFTSAAANAAISLVHLSGVGTETWLVVGCTS